MVLDTTDEKGNQDEEAVKKASILQEKTKSKISVPDTGYYYAERPSAGDFRIS